MQPYFFPYIGYWQLIAAVDLYVVYDDVNYIKGGWINRNRILIGNLPHYINLLLKGASPNKLIKDVEVDMGEREQRKLLQTLKLNYNKAPYFDAVFPLIERMLRREEGMLGDYLFELNKEICSFLCIKTPMIKSSSIVKNEALRSEEKVIDICKRLGADQYINAIGGKKLYDAEHFQTSGIDLQFIKNKQLTYRQFGELFFPNLSIIDIMMFNSVEEIRAMLYNVEFE